MRVSAHPCGVLGNPPVRLALDGGQFREVPNTCAKPANHEGPDGVKRCWQHDRMARGLSGKTPPREKAEG